ncbi:ATP-dependent RNA helicase Ddx1-like, partial [Oncorhynchus nerka]|uniref:ATP-dependent RNA helicase Ddx1-like n=1 Tax=Oncorhynchus nerka TaxID=8023 RepID=UPI0031B8487E
HRLLSDSPLLRRKEAVREDHALPHLGDLKGEDSVPETVHHVVVPVNPKHDRSWERLDRKNHILTDEVHAKDNTRPGANSSEMWSEAIKILKGEYTIRAIREHNMDQAIIFCRTKIDCDNMEQYFIVQEEPRADVTSLSHGRDVTSLSHWAGRGLTLATGGDVAPLSHGRDVASLSHGRDVHLATDGTCTSLSHVGGTRPHLATGGRDLTSHGRDVTTSHWRDVASLSHWRDVVSL